MHSCTKYRKSILEGTSPNMIGERNKMDRTQTTEILTKAFVKDQNVYQLCYLAYQHIVNEDDNLRPKLFREVSLLIKIILLNNKDIVVIKENEFDEEIVKRLDYLICDTKIKKYTEDEFDYLVWNMIEDFHDIKEKIKFIIYCVCNVNYPYFDMNDYYGKYLINENEFIDLENELDIEKEAKAIYIAESDVFEQNTEQAFAFFKLFNEVESEEEKVMLFSCFMKAYANKLKNLIERVNSY